MSDLYGPEFFVGRSETVSASAEAVVPVVCELLNPGSVLDVGCGYGEWLRVFERYTRRVVGVDIATGEELNGLTAPRFYRHDLTEPLELNVSFDLVVCLEVGEHLPEKSADTLIDTLVRHARRWIMFSAAVPGQAGTGHINLQPHAYWHAKFAERGFQMEDSIRPLIAQDHRVSDWYRRNIFLYL